MNSNLDHSSSTGLEGEYEPSDSSFGSGSDWDSIRLFDFDSNSDAETEHANGGVEGEVRTVVEAACATAHVSSPILTNPDTRQLRVICPPPIDAKLLERSPIVAIKFYQTRWCVLVKDRNSTWCVVGDGSKAALWSALDNKPNDLVHTDIDSWMSDAETKPNCNCHLPAGARAMTNWVG